MSEVKFNYFSNNWGSFDKSSNEQPKAEENPVKENVTKEETKSVSADEVLSAMDFMGQQNLVNISGMSAINPADYLSEESIASIESSMQVFEKGVEMYANSIKEEFGNTLSDEAIDTLAAEAFLLNG